jgi:ATP synthase protein I
MTDGHEPAPPGDFDERLRRARERRGGGGFGRPGRTGDDMRSGINIALRVGVELVAALIVGVAIGIGLDRWLGTTPWLMVVFIVLGAAAGILNVVRVMTGMGGAVGYRRGPNPPETDEDGSPPGAGAG